MDRSQQPARRRLLVLCPSRMSALCACIMPMGLWRMAPGPWPLAPGPWPLAPGPWPMACGLWPMAPGLWPVAHGAYDPWAWPMAYGPHARPHAHPHLLTRTHTHTNAHSHAGACTHAHAHSHTHTWGRHGDGSAINESGEFVASPGVRIVRPRFRLGLTDRAGGDGFAQMADGRVDW